MDRSVRLSVDAVIRPATGRDMAALATWSGQVDTTFRPALERDDRVVLIALANGRFPIGHVVVDLNGIISHLLVLAGFRDQGLGTGLMDEAERRLRERGATHVSLEVEKVNEDAIRLYERLGYERFGEATAVWNEPMPDGTMQSVDHPSWVMRKELRRP
jgi:ribosomal protein S18 acetylase RimI-like enzyme